MPSRRPAPRNGSLLHCPKPVVAESWQRTAPPGPIDRATSLPKTWGVGAPARRAEVSSTGRLVVAGKTAADAAADSQARPLSTCTATVITPDEIDCRRCNRQCGKVDP